MKKYNIENKAQNKKLMEKMDAVLRCFVSQNSHSIYPCEPFRARYSDRYGFLPVTATCGDAFAVVSFHPGLEGLVKERWPLCKNKPAYDVDGQLYYGRDEENTESKDISVDSLAERLGDIRQCRPENPYVLFSRMVRYYREAVPCIATVEQVSRLIAVAKKLGEKTVKLYSCSIANSLHAQYARVMFQVGGVVTVGLTMPLIAEEQ